MDKVLMVGISKIAANFINSIGKSCKGCYLTVDGQVFDRNHRGLTDARSHAGGIDNVFEFDAECKLVPQKNIDEERQDLTLRITELSGGKFNAAQLVNMSNESLRKLHYDLNKTSGVKVNETPVGGLSGANDGDDDTVNLDAMKKDELIKFLNELDPTYKVTKETKDELKDRIEAANNLADFSAENLVAIAKAFDVADEKFINETITDEKLMSVGVEDLTAIVFHLREGDDLSQEIIEKVAALVPEDTEDAE